MFRLTAWESTWAEILILHLEAEGTLGRKEKWSGVFFALGFVRSRVGIFPLYGGLEFRGRLILRGVRGNRSGEIDLLLPLGPTEVNRLSGGYQE